MRRHTFPIGQGSAVERNRPYAAVKLHGTSAAAGTGHVSVSSPTEDARTLVLPHGTLTARASRGRPPLPRPPRDARDAPRTAAAAANRGPSRRPAREPPGG